MTLRRRDVLAAAGAMAVVGGWTPAGRLAAAEAAQALPPDLPTGVEPYLEQYRNWAGNVVTDPLWHVSAGSERQVVALVGWAQRKGWKIRPKGYAHNWSPLAVGVGGSDRVLIVDTRDGLSQLSSAFGTVTAGAGVSLDALLTRLDQWNAGLAHHPAPGDLTVGGMLAIGAHGAAVPAAGEWRFPGFSYGSLANLVVSLRAVVWDPFSRSYRARSFGRHQHEIGALLVHLGRAFITEVTLRVGTRQWMRCQSMVDIPAAELLGVPGRGGRTFASYLDRSGRVELIWFPFTEKPWLKVWTLMPWRPIGVRATSSPYNYPFADSVPPEAAELVAQVIADPSLTPQAGMLQYSAVAEGLAATGTADLWGPSSAVLRYVRPTTLRMMANGYAILCSRADVQWVVNTVYARFQSQLQAYAARGEYPVNGPVEIRATGLDDPADVMFPGAGAAWLSPTRPRPDRPGWTCAIWLDLLTLNGTRNTGGFYREFERFLFDTFDGGRAGVRVEWSKGWAYSAEGAWSDDDVLRRRIPASLDAGQPFGTRFGDAVRVLNQLDPHRIYSSPLLDRLL